MFGLDNPSGISVMPAITPANNAMPLWFTEGGAGLSASYPGQEWFNQVQAELLGVLREGGITPDKSRLNQLAVAIKAIVSNGITLTDRTGNSSRMAASQKLVTEINENANSRLSKRENGADIPNKKEFVKNLGLAGTVELAKNAIPASAITQYSGNSPSHVMSQNTVTKSLNDKLDKTGGQITTNDRFLVLKNQSDNAANYLEAVDANGNIRYRLGCMSSDSALQLVNVAGKTTLSIQNSAIYVNGFKLATEDRMDKNYVSKIRLIFSREIEIDRGIFPALKPGEVVTGVRGSTRDLYYEARNLRLHVIQYLVNNEWVTANA